MKSGEKGKFILGMYSKYGRHKIEQEQQKYGEIIVAGNEAV